MQNISIYVNTNNVYLFIFKYFIYKHVSNQFFFGINTLIFTQNLTERILFIFTLQNNVDRYLYARFKKKNIRLLVQY